MTVVSVKKGNFTAQIKKSSWEEARRIKVRGISDKRVYFLNIGILTAMISCFAGYCFLNARAISLRLDIQRLEKSSIVSEEKNAVLKTELAELNASPEIVKILSDARFVRDDSPRRFALENKAEHFSYGAAANGEN